MNVNEQFSEMKRGVIELISEVELKSKLSLGRPLRVKFGADPSAPDLTLGHCVQLRALRKMQDLGHQVVFIIGDFTAMIGDPSGRSVTRPQLSREQVRENAETYVSQAGKVLDMSKAEVRFNSEWLDKLTPYEMIKLAGKFTVAQLLEREDFAKRFKEQAPIGIHELFYPLMQGYDSYAVEADIEFGGTDQTFNLMMGREVQGLYGMKEQVVITRPLIPGTDGTKKMSKSLGNYIAVLDAPQEMFGKVMSLPDHLIAMYFEYLTDLPMSEIDEMAKAMKSGELNPRNVKDKLAQEIVTTMYDAEVGRGVSEEFRRTFSGRTQTLDDFRAAAEDIELASEIIGTSVSLAKLMQESGMTSSSGEARRLIQQGAVYINNDKITDPQILIVPAVNMIIRAGKRRIINIISK